MRAKAIYKYYLKGQRKETLMLPLGAKILSVQTQYNGIVFWAEVDPENANNAITFYCVPTGLTPPESKYLGTIQQMEGAFVLHVYYSLGEC